MPSNSWPIIGHLHLLSGLPHISLGKLADKYGSIFMIKLGKDRALVVSSAEMAKECLGAGDKVFLNRPQNIFVQLMAYNSAMLGFSPYGEYWRKLRKITTIELLSNHRVEMLKNVRVSEVRSGINRISGAGSDLVDMKQWFHEISINTIIRLVSGKTSMEFYQSEVYNQFIKAIRDVFELAGVFVPADALPFLRWMDIGGYEKKMQRVAKVIDVVAQKWLEEHKERTSAKEKEEKSDFMDVMLSVYETEQDKPFKFDSDTIIKATSMDCNASTSIDILTNFYNGATIEYHFIREEGALVYLQKKWEKLHYLGVSRGIDMDPFFSWENLGFSLLFVGQLQPMFDYGLNCSVVFIKTLEVYELEVVSTNQECAMSFIARFSLGIFVSLLARLRALPPTIAIRFINSFAELIPEQETVKKLWIPLDDQRVSDFIDHPHHYELVMHLVHDVARAYFLLQLPIELSDRERCVLLMMGLQQKVLREVADELEFDQPMVILSLRDVFQKSMDYFNQTPEVVDFKPNKKKRF